MYTIGTSYLPLHERALNIAKEVGPIGIKREKKKSIVINAYERILKEVEKGRIGFKRKYVRC